jgi:hypothetical protein
MGPVLRLTLLQVRRATSDGTGTATICAAMDAAMLAGLIPENLFENPRAIVTAGVADESTR